MKSQTTCAVCPPFHASSEGGNNWKERRIAYPFYRQGERGEKKRDAQKSSSEKKKKEEKEKRKGGTELTRRADIDVPM